MIKAGALTNTTITTPTGLTVPTYNGQAVPLPTATAANPNAVQSAQNALNNLPPGSYATADLETIAALAGTGAAIGVLGGPIGSAIGAVIGGVAGVLVIVLPGIFGFIADCSASQNAENALGQAINQIQGQTGTVSAANQSLIVSLNSLVRQDFQQNGTANWPIFIQQNGQPGNISTSREPECGSSWGILCVLYTILHTRPSCSVSTAAHKTYGAMVHEAMTNLAKYLTGLGNTAIANQVTLETVSSQVITGSLNLNQILNASKPASSSVTGLPAFSSASFSGILPVALIGALVLGVVYSGKKRKV